MTDHHHEALELPWLYIEDDPGIPAGRLDDPYAGLTESTAAELRAAVAGELEEGKAIGGAQLSANVGTRDSDIRMRYGTGLTGGTLIRGHLRQAATNLQRELKPYIKEVRRGRRTIPTGIVRRTMRRFIREWLNGRLTDSEMRQRSSAKLREFYEVARGIGRRAAGLEKLGRRPEVLREEEEWFRGAVRDELAYWNRFLSDIEAQWDEGVDEDRIYERVDAYVRAVKFMVEAARVQALPDTVLVYWMGPKKNDPTICSGCEQMMEWSPFPKELLPAVPRDGTTPCLTNCRHRIVVRVAKQFNDVVRRKGQLDRMRIETRRRPSFPGLRARMVRRLEELKEDAWGPSWGPTRNQAARRQQGRQAAGGQANPFRREKLPKVPAYRTLRQRMRESLDLELQRRRPLTEATPGYHTTFDATPYASMDLRDSARLLLQAARARDKAALVPLLDRLLSALEHTTVAIEGRPRGMQVAKLFRAAFRELIGALEELPEATQEDATRARRLLEAMEAVVDCPA